MAYGVPTHSVCVCVCVCVCALPWGRREQMQQLMPLRRRKRGLWVDTSIIPVAYCCGEMCIVTRTAFQFNIALDLRGAAVVYWQIGWVVVDGGAGRERWELGAGRCARECPGERSNLTMAAEPHFPFLLEGPPAVVPSPPAALLAVDQRSPEQGASRWLSGGVNWSGHAWGSSCHSGIGWIDDGEVGRAQWNPSRHPSYTLYMPARYYILRDWVPVFLP